MSIFQKFTLRSLRKSKVRTAATIVGIVLSVALFTAVTTGVSSLMDFMKRVVGEVDGTWYVRSLNAEEADIPKVAEDPEVEKYGCLQNLGYAKLEKPWNKDRPYLFVGAFKGNIMELCPIHLLEGRMPENSGEVILPKELLEYGNTGYKIGDSLELTLGVRLCSGERQNSRASYIKAGKNDPGEQWKESGAGTFRVVGVYQSSYYESGALAGYTLLTHSDDKVKAEGTDVYVTLKDPGKSQAFCDRIASSLKNDTAAVEINDSYLRYSGLSMDNEAGKVLISLMLILMGIIMFGSVSLIYNSFSISINERKKQYGLLSSIGATRKQLRRSVLFESVVLSAIGIPLGVLLGLGGLSVTLYCLKDTFARFLNDATAIPIELTMSASLVSILLAAAVGFITVLLSAWIPARKAMKISAIEVIRQADDVRISPRSIRVSFLTRKLFGLPGILGSKNFKRNKRRYRATVISLFVSILIFVSASSFCDYMSSSLEDIVTMYGCDLYYSGEEMDQWEERYEKMSHIKGVTKSEYHYLSISLGDRLLLDISQMSDSYKDSCGLADVDIEKKPEEKKQLVDVGYLFVNDDNYREFLKENHLDTERFMDKEKPVAVMVDEITDYDSAGLRYRNYHALEESEFRTDLLFSKDKTVDELYREYQKGVDQSPQEIESCTGKKKLDGQGRLLVEQMRWRYTYETEDGGDGVDGQEIAGSEKWVPLEDAYQVLEMEIGARTEKGPYGTDADLGNGITLLFPASVMEKVLPHSPEMAYMAFDADDPDETYKGICGYLNEVGLSTGDLRNIYGQVQSNTALMTVIQVFSYGFIILISLIALTNVFNTISTNISLRRREFAMLRSVGMTKSGFNKMMCYECLLYGCKGILFGLPASIGVTLLIYCALLDALVQDFYVPWYSIVIAVGSVFLVVFATMMYAMRKVKKDNVVDTLKQENY